MFTDNTRKCYKVKLLIIFVLNIQHIIFLNKKFLIHPTYITDSIAEIGNREDCANTKLLKINKSNNVL